MTTSKNGRNEKNVLVVTNYHDAVFKHAKETRGKKISISIMVFKINF